MKYLIFLILSICITSSVKSQSNGYWHGKERELRYHPEGEDFVIVNGDKKFNKALYGTNTAFRVETGDVPEFGFFMPNMGGNMQLGLVVGDKSLWLNDAQYIKTRSRGGARIYEIKDPLIQSGKIEITVLAMARAEGMILKVCAENLPQDVDLISTFGGASNKRFFRNGDLGVDDPNAFSLQPDACLKNEYKISETSFELTYAQGAKGGDRKTIGIFPSDAQIRLSSPYQMMTPLNVWKSGEEEKKPIIVSRIPMKSNREYYVAIKVKDTIDLLPEGLEKCFNDAEKRRKEIVETVKINTPDPYFNTLGGVLGAAADGIWDDKTGWQHGAIGWRMPLNGWRGGYTGDVIGWHERARQHFDGFAASQIKNIPATIPHPTQDKELHLARAEKTWGTQMYSNGYITRNPNETKLMHHYDMNLVYIDQLLWYFNWTGDMDYVRKMWPTLKLHLEWEKRNFDPDNDGLYDAYAGIWASDALQYNSGGVTHSSAYNYRANKMAAQIAAKIGEDPKPYADEAKKILLAINSRLWMPDKGWWAEYQDFMGNKMLHPNAAIWTVYHAIDSDIHDPFQAYQATRYVDNEIPHISVLARGLEDENLKTVSTTNWVPYSWSINNVAFAEVGHTSLAYWQAGRKEEAFSLFKSNVLDGMYMGGSPGNIGQISFYDAARGECYRDFADPVGVYSRALVQGLFGIAPDAMNGRLVIRPGFPSAWNFASISMPNVSFDFSRNKDTDRYTIEDHFNKSQELELLISARKDDIRSLKVNGKESKWNLVKEGIDSPLIKIVAEAAERFDIEIVWGKNDFFAVESGLTSVKEQEWVLNTKAKIQKIYDPQKVLTHIKQSTDKIVANTVGTLGNRTVFVELKQGKMTWWQPVNIEMKELISINYDPENPDLEFSLVNNGNVGIEAQIIVNNRLVENLFTLGKGQESRIYSIPNDIAKLGTNRVEIVSGNRVIFRKDIINWNVKNNNPEYETVDMDKVLNASVSQIFKNEYLTPRSPYTTLQVPTQGIGEWCHPLLTADVDDSGLRKSVKNHIFQTPLGIPFRTPAEDKSNNIAFTTLWDNYPDSVSIPLSGKASHAYLMMAGSTNHMQAHVANGRITLNYRDGSEETVDLINPENWAPIEQDYYFDNNAFYSTQPRPYRIALKTGIVTRNMEKDMGVNPEEVYDRKIDGGAGIILDIPLDSSKELKDIQVKAVANEVVIGLMGVTLLK